MVLVLTGIYTFKTAPVYRATASIEVETDYPQLQTINEVYRQAPTDDFSFLTTQMQVLQSDNLAWTTMQQLGLDRDPAPAAQAMCQGNRAAQIAGARKTSSDRGF